MSQAEVGRQEAKALRQLTVEAEQAPLPAVDFDGIQERLLAEIANENKWRQPRRREGGTYGTLVAFAAVAAAVVMVIAGQGGETSAPIAELPPVDLGELQHEQAANDALPAYRVDERIQNRIVESGDEPVKFKLAGVASWTLAPRSRVRVRTTSVPHEIILDKGKVYAEVVPRYNSEQLVESFAVEAGTTRVAVHGTVFSVSREAKQVVVEVSHGVVTVGPAGHRGATTGRLLVSPAREAFALEGGKWLDGAPLKVVDEPPGAPAEPALAPVAAAGVDSGDEAAASAAEESPVRGAVKTAPSVLAEEARTARLTAASDVEKSAANARAAEAPDVAPVPAGLSANQARAVMVACLNSLRDGRDSSGLRVTVSSTVSVSLNADGAVQSVQFNPPLRPDMQQRCGGALLGKRVDLGGRQGSFRVHFATR